MELTVSSTRDHGRNLVEAEVEPTEAPRSLRSPTGAVTPCQYDESTNTLLWILESSLAAGEERMYETSDDDAPGANWRVEEKPDHLNLRIPKEADLSGPDDSHARASWGAKYGEPNRFFDLGFLM